MVKNRLGGHLIINGINIQTIIIIMQILITITVMSYFNL